MDSTDHVFFQDPFSAFLNLIHHLVDGFFCGKLSGSQLLRDHPVSFSTLWIQTNVVFMLADFLGDCFLLA